MNAERADRAILARLALPTFAAVLGDQLLGIADTIVIGNFGPQSLAAITGASAVFVVLVLALHGTSQGAGILGAQAIGAGAYDRFGRIIRSAIVVPALIAVTLAAGSIWLAKPGLRALIGPLASVDAGGAYLMLRCFGLLPVVISSLGYTAFGAAGNTRFGFQLLVCINLIHLPLLVVLALGWGTHHALGLVGAGISSLCAESVGALYAIVLAWRQPLYRIFARRELDLRLALRIFWLGLPEAVYLFLVVAPDIAIVAVLSPLGAMTVAGFRVLSIVSDVTWAVPESLGNATQIVIGQRFGAGNIAGAKSFERGALGYAVGLSAAFGLAVALFSRPIAYAFTLDGKIASLAAAPLAVHMLTLPLKGYAMLGIARVRAAGDTRFSMIVGIIASAIVIPGTWFAVHLGNAGLFAVPLAWIAAWLFWCGATAIRLHRFDWNAARLAV